FVPGSRVNGGSDIGACYQPDLSCSVIERESPEHDAAGLQCVDSGGLFVPGADCTGTPPAGLNFGLTNAHYVSPLVIIDKGQVEAVPLEDSRSRGFRARIETHAAIEWINSRPAQKPWMATLSFSSAHTPWQQPPRSMLAGNKPADDRLDCSVT